MAFKRALWHSGLTYQQTCTNCRTIFQYMDDKLDFRPWYADGFVYCPNCQTPLRHNERLAINAPAVDPDTPIQNISTNQSVPLHSPSEAAAPTGGASAFCTRCGKQFGVNDRFCSGCGTKR